MLMQEPGYDQSNADFGHTLLALLTRHPSSPLPTQVSLTWLCRKETDFSIVSLTMGNQLLEGAYDPSLRK